MDFKAALMVQTALGSLPWLRLAFQSPHYELAGQASFISYVDPATFGVTPRQLTPQ